MPDDPSPLIALIGALLVVLNIWRTITQYLASRKPPEISGEDQAALDELDLIGDEDRLLAEIAKLEAMVARREEREQFRKACARQASPGYSVPPADQVARMADALIRLEASRLEANRQVEDNLRQIAFFNRSTPYSIPMDMKDFQCAKFGHNYRMADPYLTCARCGQRFG